MKGIVFTELLEMVEQKFGEDMVEDIIEDAKVEGVYTAVGTYDHAELVKLVVALSENTSIEVTTLLFEFGKYLFGVFLKNYPHFFEQAGDLFSFLSSIEDHIHVEVRKLYPEAELPGFESEVIDNKHMHLKYFSKRKMSEFALGLISASMDHFGVQGETRVIESKDDGAEVHFEIALE